MFKSAISSLLAVLLLSYASVGVAEVVVVATRDQKSSDPDCTAVLADVRKKMDAEFALYYGTGRRELQTASSECENRCSGFGPQYCAQYASPECGVEQSRRLKERHLVTEAENQKCLFYKTTMSEAFTVAALYVDMSFECREFFWGHQWQTECLFPESD